MKPGDRFYCGALLTGIFVAVTPIVWWQDAIVVIALLAVGTVVNARDRRVW